MYSRGLSEIRQVESKTHRQAHQQGHQKVGGSLASLQTTFATPVVPDSALDVDGHVPADGLAAAA